MYGSLIDNEKWRKAWASVRQVGLEQCKGNPGTEQADGEGGDHQLLGDRSLGRLTT